MKAEKIKKYLRNVLLLAAAVFAANWFWPGLLSRLIGTLSPKSVTIGVQNMRVGFAGAVFYSNGFTASSESSRWMKDWGLSVAFKQGAWEQTVKDWEDGKVDIISVPVSEAHYFLAQQQKHAPKIVFQPFWSRGGDALVVLDDVDRISDLKGQHIGYAKGFSHRYFLTKTLEWDGIDFDQVQTTVFESQKEILDAFVEGKIDAAMLSDDQLKACLKRFAKNAKMLVSTASGSHIVGEVLVAKASYIEKNKGLVENLTEGWASANAEINDNPEKMVSILALLYKIPHDDVRKMLKTFRLCNAADNRDVFGLSKGFMGLKIPDLIASTFANDAFLDTLASKKVSAQNNYVKEDTFYRRVMNVNQITVYPPEGDSLAAAIHSTDAQTLLQTDTAHFEMQDGVLRLKRKKEGYGIKYSYWNKKNNSYEEDSLGNITIAVFMKNKKSKDYQLNYKKFRGEISKSNAASMNIYLPQTLAWPNISDLSFVEKMRPKDKREAEEDKLGKTYEDVSLSSLMSLRKKQPVGVFQFGTKYKKDDVQMLPEERSKLYKDFLVLGQTFEYAVFTVSTHCQACPPNAIQTMEAYYGFKRSEAIVKYFNEVGGMETNRMIAVEKTNLKNIKPVYLDNESFTLDSGQYYVEIQIAVLPK